MSYKCIYQGIVSLTYDDLVVSSEAVKQLEEAAKAYNDAEVRLIDLCLKHEVDCEIRTEKFAGIRLCLEEEKDSDHYPYRSHYKMPGQWITSTEDCR